MKAVILITGSEFTEGRKSDKNGNYIAKRLFERGVDVEGIIIAPDNYYLLVNYIKYSLDKADLVIVSGGLGPTSDDFTRSAIADAIGVPLIYEETCLSMLKIYYISSGVEFTPERKSMCKIPYGAVKIDNPVGRAIGFLKVLDGIGKVIVALPGVPTEMKPMLDDVLGRLMLHKKVRLVKLFRTFGMKELDINYLLKDIKSLSYSVSPKGVDIFLSDVDENSFHNKTTLVRERLGNYIYTEGDREMEDVVGEILRMRGLTVSTAESSTGGLAISRLINVPGSSEYVKGSVVSYSNSVKVETLKVNPELIEKFGAVSENVAKEMAVGVRSLLRSDIALSDTGIAGPTGWTSEKPLGLHYIAYADHADVEVFKEIYTGERNDVRLYISQYMLNLIRLKLQ